LKKLKKIWNLLLFDTYGNIALASFVICIVSGVFLAVPYDVESAYDSIALMLITNLPAVFFRNLHYWSAQFFLIFTLLHTWEHIKLRSAMNSGIGIWFRQVISLIFVFFVMLSGFILKADADSLQAYRILESLIIKIPIAGDFFASLILGEEGTLQLIYVHHIATATIFLFFIIFEHTGTLWSKRSTFMILLAITTILSFFVHAPLHDNLNGVLKGPWYFVGLQEIMYWTGHPGWIWMIILILLSIVFMSIYAGEKTNRILYKIISFLSIAYLILTLIGYYFRGENWEWSNPWNKAETEKPISLEVGLQRVSSRFKELTSSDIPVVRGKREACMNCHTGVTGFSPSHDPVAIGCTSCHFGNPFTLDKAKAHKNMTLIPGNLINASLSCGTTDCHPEIAERINTSLMTTNSGIVSVDRFVFGESDSPDVLSHIKDIGHGTANKHLRDLCASCHLGNEKTETGAIDQMSRGGGCNACHLNYSKEGIEQHIAYLSGNKAEKLLPHLHPSLDILISNDHCFGCHSRSGRISTNFEGWHETLLDEKDVTGHTNYRVLQDKRVFEFISADVHHTAGMDCIDCHNSYEVMGDGNLYMHEESAVKIRCEDCHFNTKPETTTYDQLDAESKNIFDLRKFKHSKKNMIKGSKSGIALINTIYEKDMGIMISKNSGKVFPLSPPASICSKDHAHESLTCSSCHTAWAPQCIGCHNAFDPEATGFDLLENKFAKGEWVEYVGIFFAESPTLGVREGKSNKIEPAIPGMIMTIDKASYQFSDNLMSSDDSILFHRLFAPAAPHTTSTKGRSCKSCHNNPLAIGYGRGELIYEIKDGAGKWNFTPQFAANKYDGLPEDAWIGFLTNTADKIKSPGINWQSTRTDFRPFSITEQKRILQVGACLTCHDMSSEVILESLDEDFTTYLNKVSNQCILPEW